MKFSHKLLQLKDDIDAAWEAGFQAGGAGPVPVFDGYGALADIVLFYVSGNARRAIAGMTWKEFIASEFNVSGYTYGSTILGDLSETADGYVRVGSYAVALNGVLVMSYDSIKANASYFHQ